MNLLRGYGRRLRQAVGIAAEDIVDVLEMHFGVLREELREMPRDAYRICTRGLIEKNVAVRHESSVDRITSFRGGSEAVNLGMRGPNHDLRATVRSTI